MLKEKDIVDLAHDLSLLSKIEYLARTRQPIPDGIGFNNRVASRLYDAISDVAEEGCQSSDTRRRVEILEKTVAAVIEYLGAEVVPEKKETHPLSVRAKGSVI